jgi:hypothetical protein
MALIGVGTALAAGGVSTVSVSRSFKKTAATSARCPKGEHALGGGFSLPSHGIAQQSFPAGRRWKLEAFNFEDGTSTMRAFARCEPTGSGALKVVKRSKRTSEPAVPTVTAKCPRRSHVVSGGYKVSPPFDPNGSDAGEIAVFESRRVSARTWRVKGENVGDATNLVAYALCRSNRHGSTSQVANSAVIAAAVTSVTAGCPAGTHSTGGGFKAPLPPGDRSPVVSASKPKGQRNWTATYVAGTGESGKVVSYAYCDAN